MRVIVTFASILAASLVLSACFGHQQRVYTTQVPAPPPPAYPPLK